jgi:hypothetical protein
MDLRAVLNVVEKKILTPSGIRLPAVQPVARRYTVCALLTPRFDSVALLHDSVAA